MKIIADQSSAETCHVELFLDKGRSEAETIEAEREAVIRSVAAAERILSDQFPESF